MPNRQIINGEPYRYAYQGQEKDPETGKEAFQLRLWDGRIGRWLTTDPKGQYHSPYMGMDNRNRPMSSIDPDGGSTDGEYEKINGKWTKVSTKGDDIGVDFYHFDSYVDGKHIQTTIATEMGADIYDMSANSAVIRGGRNILKGETRGLNVDWDEIWLEFKGGYGPEHSYFEGGHPATGAIKEHYLYQEAYGNFLSSGKSKGRFPVSFTPWDALVKTPAHDYQAQMMGSYSLSFYKIGNRVLSIALDSKTRESLYLHLPLHNPPRVNSLVPGKNGWVLPDNRQTNTYQKYIFWND